MAVPMPMPNAGTNSNCWVTDHPLLAAKGLKPSRIGGRPCSYRAWLTAGAVKAHSPPQDGEAYLHFGDRDFKTAMEHKCSPNGKAGRRRTL